MMALGFDATGFAGAISALPRQGGDAGGRALAGHAFIGAVLLFVGSLLVAELLAGQVYGRSRFLTMLWPAGLAAAGLGMLMVTYLQPDGKALHLALAFLLFFGGFVEARCRLGQVSRTTADLIEVPALILGGFVIGPMHANGPMSSISAQSHILVGLVGFSLAGVRLTQVRYSDSAALDATFGVGVMLLGLSLLLVQQLHHHH
ncbi:MAG TPA: hypothetical protein VFT91_05890 [Dehalococcoidia bacterium]|nr:hypothetical protein [Dehalococcoidia bacterium]